jgi:arginine repressor
VHELLRDEPDRTIAELRSRLAAEAIHVSPAAISRFLAAEGLTRKKTQPAAEQERSDVAAARAAWRQQQATLSPERLVLIDETWTTTTMVRRHGRARCGERLVAAVPHDLLRAA